MTRGIQATDHVWLVMMKAMRALTRYAVAGFEETGLGLSDFAVLEVLVSLELHPWHGRQRDHSRRRPPSEQHTELLRLTAGAARA